MIVFALTASPIVLILAYFGFRKTLSVCLLITVLFCVALLAEQYGKLVVWSLFFIALATILLIIHKIQAYVCKKWEREGIAERDEKRYTEYWQNLPPININDKKY